MQLLISSDFPLKICQFAYTPPSLVKFIKFHDVSLTVKHGLTFPVFPDLNGNPVKLFLTILECGGLLSVDRYC